MLIKCSALPFYLILSNLRGIFLFFFFNRLEKESIQRSISNEAKARALQAQQREQELTQKMQQMEAQHEKTGRW